jgi:hypothetical protein
MKILVDKRGACRVVTLELVALGKVFCQAAEENRNRNQESQYYGVYTVQ